MKPEDRFPARRHCGSIKRVTDKISITCPQPHRKTDLMKVSSRFMMILNNYYFRNKKDIQILIKSLLNSSTYLDINIPGKYLA